MLINTFFTIVASVLLFLFAIKKFSRQIRVLGGDRFKGWLETATQTPLRGVVTGAAVTSIVQSSTAVTVILIGLVDAGVISFYNTLGVLLGASIGTTLTTQLVAFKIIYFAPYIVILGFALEYLNTKYQKYAKSIFYFGLVLLSLYYIMLITGPLKTEPIVLDVFARISNVFFAIGAGFLATLLFQSSSVVSGIVVLLVAQGFFSFDQAFGILMGANIGTTSTALIASLVMNASAKKTAIAYFLFNLIGVTLFIPLVDDLHSIIRIFDFSLDKEVAMAYSAFALIKASFFLLFLNYFYHMVNKVYHVIFPVEE
jgi:phosphate:Na+ symporter